MNPQPGAAGAKGGVETKIPALDSYSLLFEVANPVPWVFVLYSQAAASERTNHQQHTTFGLDSWQMQNII